MDNQATAPLEAIQYDAGKHHGWIRPLDAFLGHLIEIPVALLVLAEVAILFSGIFARYVLNTPLIWSDELASLLFLWLAMLGAAVAFRRGEHMRMTAFVNMAKPSTQAFLHVFALSVSLTFVVLVLAPSFNAAAEQSVITTPALGISMAWRTAALPTGLTFMLVFAVLRLIEVSNWRLVGTTMTLMD